ncbi:hypothetical protein KC221_22810, partial [Mycobacterium tuberculosis]|nr:hypothetical protein [Mycobacterium tuberculosis]
MNLQNTAIPITDDYEVDIIKLFSIMAVVYGIIGMAVGVFIASQWAWPALTFGIPWLTFSRVRPLHT